MQLMDEILSDKTMDRIERIDKLEAILSAATLLPNETVKKYLPIYFLILLYNQFTSFLSGLFISAIRESIEHIQLE